MKAISFSVRAAAEPDIEDIIAIERAWPHLSHWSVDAYNRLLRIDSFTSSLVAEIEATDGCPRIAGFVIYHIADRVSEIYNIAVERDHARAGIGAALMQGTLGASKQKGAHKLILEVRKSNRDAIRFYKRFALGIVGEWHNYYSNPLEDAFVMERDLRL
jgi:ribosomal-protein-alanine N-acetyltransferase